MMKKTIFKYATILVIMTAFTLPVMAQPDTLTKPDRTSTFQDSKITDDNSKVLLDTSSKLADSLLNKKPGKKRYQQKETDPMGEADKPIKIKRSPADSTRRTVRP